MQSKTFEARSYTIRSGLGGNYVLDCSLNQEVNKKFSAILYQKNNNQNQKFEIIRQGNSNFYVIYNRHLNKILQVKDSKINNGAKVIFGQSKGSINELWQLIRVSNTNSQYNGLQAYYLRSFCGKTIDVKQQKAINNSQIFQYQYNGNTNQIWIFQ